MNKLREIRLAYGISSPRELAKILDVPAKVIGDFEQDIPIEDQGKVLFDLAELFNVSPYYLLNIEVARTSTEKFLDAVIKFQDEFLAKTLLKAGDGIE